ncbi:Aldo-keto reductase [Trichostrongylus colubriformis]|uniref:Aldo-keto reductase n=1 Tax=Trichostrongylus colubriformis TaxID=6319 RepID=A0AAN8G3W1_TRICO
MVTMSVHGPKLTLSNGKKMPQVGLGTWQSTPEEVKAVVKTAIEAGYRLIDTAAVYENEDAIGEAIKEMIDAGKVTRDELFITTKVWVTHLHPDDTETSIRKSLTKLKMDYVDLLLAHMPTCFNHDMTEQNKSVTVQDVWRGLESVYNKGLTKAIGVSNWSGEQIERVMKTATVPIHNCQVELHLYWPQHEIHEICKKHNITLTSYATLGSPGRSKFMPDKFGWKDAANDLDDPNVKKLAEKYSKTPAQILLRYAIDRSIAIIPKSVKPERVVENFKLFDFSLTSDDIELLENDSTKHRQRLFTDDFMIGHPEDPFAAERNK